LEDLVKSCRLTEDNPVALFLFDYLTNVRLRMKQDGGGSGRQADWEVVLMGLPSALRFAWRQVFLPRLNEFAMQLEPIVTNRLRQAQILLSSVGKSDQRSDLISAVRSAPRAAEQDSNLGTGVDFLADAARDLIGWLSKHEPARAARIIANWFDSGVPILEQIASGSDQKTPVPGGKTHPA
jgi:hypothetical protein